AEAAAVPRLPADPAGCLPRPAVSARGLVGRAGSVESDIDGLLEPIGTPHDIKWPRLHLVEDAADIATQYSQRQKLDATQEHHRDDQRFEARHVDAVEDRADDAADAVDQADAGDQGTENSPEPQRQVRKCGNAVDGERRQPPEAPAAAPFLAHALLIAEPH